MKTQIKFYIPKFNLDNPLNPFLIKLFCQSPEYFYDNISIGGVYDSFPNAIWNGGRGVIGQNYTREQIRQTIEQYNSLGVPLNFTFTNCLLEEKHLKDEYCNLILEEAQNGMNHVVVNSPILDEYIRENYPLYELILSTTCCLRDLSIINEKLDYYHMICLDYNDNHNYPFLKSIKNKSKIELLLDAYCYPNCPRRKEHYSLLSYSQLNPDKPRPSFECDGQCFSFFDAIRLGNFIDLGEVYKILPKMGFTNFKIEGRTVYPCDLIESYVYYLVKPRYKDEVRNKLLVAAYH